MDSLRVRTWTMRRRVLVLFAVAGVLLAGLGTVASMTAVDSNRNLDVLLDKTGPMRVAGQELYSAYLDQETGVRGFALSRSAKNLQPYEQGVAAEKELLVRIDQLNGPGGRAAIRTDLQRVRQLADQWRADVADPVIAAGASGTSLDEAANDSRFNALRTAVDTLQADILALRDEAAAAARRTASVLVVLEIVAAVILAVVGGLMLLLLDRLVSRPIAELTRQVRRVAGGDFEHRIASAGSPELTSLAGDVDGMRQRIASELSEVREARTQVLEANRQLEFKADELSRSNRDLEQFAYVASHDLQEPLRKVASFCQLLQRRYAGKLDERADQYIAFAVDGAQRMQRLINDLLAFSRVGRLTTGFTSVPLDRVLTEVGSQLESRGGDVSWSAMPTVEGEEPLLTTLFANLIGNSLKFRRPDVPPVVRVNAERDGDEWRINVRDNGIGIEREFADKVFVIFQRLHPREAYDGTGIGLAIAKKIVEYHGGRIWLDLDAEEGTSIWFTLPVPAPA
ncbi:MAG: ATP-binding protein [Actinomycetota bacterium]|nr:ATP-binding protein [Actinomycetota bacterium]